MYSSKQRTSIITQKQTQTTQNKEPKQSVVIYATKINLPIFVSPSYKFTYIQYSLFGFLEHTIESIGTHCQFAFSQSRNNTQGIISNFDSTLKNLSFMTTRKKKQVKPQRKQKIILCNRKRKANLYSTVGFMSTTEYSKTPSNHDVDRSNTLGKIMK